MTRGVHFLFDEKKYNNLTAVKYYRTFTTNSHKTYLINLTKSGIYVCERPDKKSLYDAVNCLERLPGRFGKTLIKVFSFLSRRIYEMRPIKYRMRRTTDETRLRENKRLIFFFFFRDYGIYLFK